MKKILSVLALMTVSIGGAQADVNSKTWPASDAAVQFVRDTIVIGMLANPYGTGWTENKQLQDYFQLARDNGITGHEMTLAAI